MNPYGTPLISVVIRCKRQTGVTPLMTHYARTGTLCGRSLRISADRYVRLNVPYLTFVQTCTPTAPKHLTPKPTTTTTAV